MLPDDPKERINWIRPADFAGWEYLIAHSSRHLWTVYHETYTICASPHYGQTWAYRGRRHTMRSPGLMLIEPGETHRTLSNPSCVRFKVAMIPPEDVAMAIGELGLPANLHLRTALTADDGLNQAVWQLGEIAESGAASLLEIESRQAEIVRRLLGYAERAPSLTDDSSETRAVGRAKDLLRTSLNRQVTLDELAAASGLGRYRLVRAFTRAVGSPPHAYHLQLRIAEARRLLQKGRTGSEIAAGLGFTDQPHFIRHFQKILRVSPGKYARGCDDALSIGIPGSLPRAIEMGWHDERMLNEREHLIVDLVRPYIAQIWRETRLNERVKRQLRVLEECIEQLNTGVIECSARGRVNFINSRGRQHLADYFGVIRQANGLLPDALLRWVRAHELLFGGSDDAPPVRSPLVIDKGSKRLLLRLLSQEGEHLILMEEQTVSTAGNGSTSLALTAREREVLDWIARGKTNQEIAIILAMRTATVKKHVEHILQKLGVETRTAAAAMALERQESDGILDTQRKRS